VVEIPVWPFMATVVVGAAATVVQYALSAWAEFRRAAESNNGRRR
jgi:hypothetical protein